MRFALLGDHPDGLAMARALAATGHHQWLAYSGPAIGGEYLRRWGIAATSVGDVEEILADPAIEAVIVAAKVADRPAQLRRALQSERHVLCVHPADATPDFAYEAAMIQTDTKMMLLPLLPDAHHPGVRRLAELLHSSPPPERGRLIEMERTSTEAVLLETDTTGHDPGLPGWDVLRLWGGEVVEIVGLASAEEVLPEAPQLLAGRFENGGLFQMTLLPRQAETRCRWSVLTGTDRIELAIAEDGAALLTWRDEFGNAQQESWPSWDPWAALVESWEEALASQFPDPLPWQTEVRCLELDAAARRSVERRRSITLDFQEITEEVGFKGTMTLVGCSLLWGSLVLLVASVWVPWMGWLILPMFGIFLLLQALRRLVPTTPDKVARPEAPTRGEHARK